MPTAFALITFVVLGETCAVPNDDTLVGKTDEKVSEHHSPQAGTETKHPVYFFNYLFMGQHCCVQAFCSSGGYCLVAMKGLLVVAPSLVVEHRLYVHWLQ